MRVKSGKNRSRIYPVLRRRQFLVVVASVFDLMTEIARREGEGSVQRRVVVLDGHHTDVPPGRALLGRKTGRRRRHARSVHVGQDRRVHVDGNGSCAARRRRRAHFQRSVRLRLARIVRSGAQVDALFGWQRRSLALGRKGRSRARVLTVEADRWRSHLFKK